MSLEKSGKKKQFPVKALYSGCPRLWKTIVAAAPVLTQWPLSSTSSVGAVAPMTPDICVTLPGSEPTVEVVWVEGGGGGEGSDQALNFS